MLELPPILLGTFCPTGICGYPSGQNFVISTKPEELTNYLPNNWNNNIFYRTLHYINRGVHIILYKDNTVLLAPSTPKPLIFLVNTETPAVSEINILLSQLYLIDAFLFFNTNHLTYVDINLYAPSDPMLRKFACMFYGNMYMLAIDNTIWNVGDYIMSLARLHNELMYFCPLNDRVRGNVVGHYSNSILNQMRNNHFNVPFRNKLIGPMLLSGDLFAIVYAHIIIKRVTKGFLRRYLFRENNEDLWVEVESDLKNMLTMLESVPCGPVIINVLVNDSRLNRRNSRILNVEIQYSNAGTFSSFASGPHAGPGGLTIPPIGGYMGTINVQVSMP